MLRANQYESALALTMPKNQADRSTSKKVILHFKMQSIKQAMLAQYSRTSPAYMSIKGIKS